MPAAVACTCSEVKQCKHCYDQNRRAKIRSGEWTYNIDPPSILTAEQQQVLVGSMLGDSSLYKYKNHVNAGLKIGRAARDISYLKYEFDIFRNFCQSPIEYSSRTDPRTGKTYDNVMFRTCVAPVFTDVHNAWYVNQRKRIPDSLELSPLTCAIWRSIPMDLRSRRQPDWLVC